MVRTHPRPTAVHDRVIVLSNRGPVRHEWADGRVVGRRSASGLVTALEPLLEAYSGTWVAHAAGAADLTAFSLYWPETGALKVWGFVPRDMLAVKEREDNAPYRLWNQQGFIIEVPGRTVDRAWLGAWIARQIEGLELQGIASDRWLIDDLRAQLEQEGIVLPLYPHGAGFKDVSPSLTAFEALVLDGKLQHGGNPLLRWAVANAAIERGDERFEMGRPEQHIAPRIQRPHRHLGLIFGGAHRA